VFCPKERTLLRRAIRQLISFAKKYFCETGFPNYTETKTNYRNRLNAGPDLRNELSSIKPYIKIIYEEGNVNFYPH
jgi:hypothetical protein